MLPLALCACMSDMFHYSQVSIVNTTNTPVFFCNRTEIDQCKFNTDEISTGHAKHILFDTKIIDIQRSLDWVSLKICDDVIPMNRIVEISPPVRKRSAYPEEFEVEISPRVIDAFCAKK